MRGVETGSLLTEMKRCPPNPTFLLVSPHYTPELFPPLQYNAAPAKNPPAAPARSAVSRFLVKSSTRASSIKVKQ